VASPINLLLNPPLSRVWALPPIPLIHFLYHPRLCASTHMATAGKRKPVFVKVDQLKPGTAGHTLCRKGAQLQDRPAERPPRRSCWSGSAADEDRRVPHRRRDRLHPLHRPQRAGYDPIPISTVTTCFVW
jgi:hypothetical protein